MSVKARVSFRVRVRVRARVVMAIDPTIVRMDQAARCVVDEESGIDQIVAV